MVPRISRAIRLRLSTCAINLGRREEAFDGEGAVQRSAVVPRGRRGAKLHQGRGQARDRPVDSQPHHQAAGDADGHSAADAHDAERRADGGGRAPAPVARPAHRRDRGRDRRADRFPRQASRPGADHALRSCVEQRRLAEAPAGARPIPRHRGRAGHRQRVSQHRRGELRRRRPPRRGGREGHDRRPHRAGLAPRRRRARRRTSRRIPRRRIRAIWSGTTASTIGRRPRAASTPGSSSRMGRSCACGWTGS